MKFFFGKFSEPVLRIMSVYYILYISICDLFVITNSSFELENMREHVFNCKIKFETDK